MKDPVKQIEKQVLNWDHVFSNLYIDKRLAFKLNNKNSVTNQTTKLEYDQTHEEAFQPKKVYRKYRAHEKMFDIVTH